MRRALFLAAAAALTFAAAAPAQRKASRQGAPALATPPPAATLAPLAPALDANLPAAGEKAAAAPAPTLEPAASVKETPAAPARDAADSLAAKTGLPASLLLLLGIGVLILVATLIVVLAVILKKPVVINVPTRSAAPAGGDWSDVGGGGGGGTLSPAPMMEGTLKILPGRFMIEEGENQVELRIFRTSGSDREETTFGRDPGPAYRHIQLKAPSVSGKHGKLVFENGGYTLTNYSRTNPTRVNGDELPEGASRRLVDGDRIEIGEISITYYQV